MIIIIRNCCLQRNVETTVEQLYCVKYRHTLITFFPFPIQMPCFLLLLLCWRCYYYKMCIEHVRSTPHTVKLHHHRIKSYNACVPRSMCVRVLRIYVILLYLPIFLTYYCAHDICLHTPPHSSKYYFPYFLTLFQIWHDIFLLFS